MHFAVTVHVLYAIHRSISCLEKRKRAAESDVPRHEPVWEPDARVGNYTTDVQLIKDIRDATPPGNILRKEIMKGGCTFIDRMITVATDNLLATAVSYAWTLASKENWDNRYRGFGGKTRPPTPEEVASVVRKQANGFADLAPAKHEIRRYFKRAAPVADPLMSYLSDSAFGGETNRLPSAVAEWLVGVVLDSMRQMEMPLAAKQMVSVIYSNTASPESSSLLYIMAMFMIWRSYGMAPLMKPLCVESAVTRAGGCFEDDSVRTLGAVDTVESCDGTVFWKFNEENMLAYVDGLLAIPEWCVKVDHAVMEMLPIMRSMACNEYPGAVEVTPAETPDVAAFVARYGRAA